MRAPRIVCLLVAAGAAICGFGADAGGPEPPRTACSSVNLVNNGHSVFGKNLDNRYTTQGLILINKRGVQRAGRYTSTTGARARWTSRYASINFAFVHVGFVWTGMNEQGLTISMMGIPETEGPPPDERPPLLDGQWIQYMLDTCTTVEDVISAARDIRILTVDHYHVADRNGDSAVFEFLGGEEIVYTGEDLPVSVLTNSTYGDSIDDWQRFNESPFRPPNGSIERFRIAAERVVSFTSTDTDAAVDYAFDTLYDIRSERIYGYPNTTEWSFVFDTEDLRAYFKTFSHPQVKVFDLHDFDSYCDSPVQMLSVQLDRSGNVAPYFEDLTFEAACEHYRHFLESWMGQTPTQGQIEDEISRYMSLPCLDLRILPRRPSRRLP